jgi:hypothetical protein
MAFFLCIGLSFYLNRKFDPLFKDKFPSFFQNLAVAFWPFYFRSNIYCTMITWHKSKFLINGYWGIMFNKHNFRKDVNLFVAILANLVSYGLMLAVLGGFLFLIYKLLLFSN